jgi:hypothetical protein
LAYNNIKLELLAEGCRLLVKFEPADSYIVKLEKVIEASRN